MKNSKPGYKTVESTPQTARRMNFESADALSFKGLSERLTDFYQKADSKASIRGFVPRIPLTVDQIDLAFTKPVDFMINSTR